LPLVQVLQVGMLTAPGELDELVVRRAGEHDRIALLEVADELVVADDLGRADEGEVLRVEIDDLPLARERLLGDLLEGADAFLLGLVELGLDAHDTERFEFFAYGFHLELLQVRRAYDRGTKAILVRPS